MLETAGRGSSKPLAISSVLIAAACALSLAFMVEVDLSGDENHYADGARLLARALLATLAGETSHLALAFDQIRGLGFFMPGMSLLLTPVALIFGGEAPAWAFRLGMVLLNAALLVAICRSLSRSYSSRAPLVFLTLPLISPYYVFYLSALWGDLLAVHLAILFVIWLDRRLQPGSALPPFQAGGLLAVMTYVRSSYVPLILVLVAGLVLQAVRAGVDRRALLAAGGKALKAALAFFVLLLPWVLYVSAKFGPTLTVTSPPIAQIAMFGDHSYLQGLPREQVRHGGISLALHDRIAEKAKQTGRTFSAQARIERDLATQELNLPTALVRVSWSVAHYFGRPNQFSDRFWRLRCQHRPCSELVRELASAQNRVASGATLLVGLALFAFPFGVGSSQIPAFLFKALAFSICVHPYVVAAHGRYHVQLFPVVSLALAIVATTRCRAYSFDGRRAFHDALIGAGQVVAVVFVACTLLIAAVWAGGWGKAGLLD